MFLLLPPVLAVNLLPGVDTSWTLTGAAALYVGNGDHNASHSLDDSNHNGDTQGFGVTTVWFPATKEDVHVSPARARSFTIA